MANRRITSVDNQCTPRRLDSANLDKALNSGKPPRVNFDGVLGTQRSTPTQGDNQGFSIALDISQCGCFLRVSR